MFQNIYIIEENNELTKKIRNKFKSEHSFKFKNVKTNEVEAEIKAIPDLIIINEDAIGIEIDNLCKNIRQDEDNSITPIIVVSSNSDAAHVVSVVKNCIEYYIPKSVDDDLLYYTIKNIIRLLYVNRRVSPLTGLPGNIQIQTELKKRLLKKKCFEVLYFDLDNFKAYNDLYGFLAGDEIIKLTARVITRNIHDIEGSDVFVGHIGGDDFVAILDDKVDYEAICQNIVAEFDVEVLKHFSDADVEKGYLEIQNRKGTLEQFPLTSVSVGVVVADEKRFANILEIGEIGAQVKHLAKSTMGSSYAIDRRKEE